MASPIKDGETFNKMELALKNLGDKYLVMFETGIETGMRLGDILLLKVKDLNRREFSEISPELKRDMEELAEGKNPDDYLITGYKGDNVPLSRQQAYRVLKNAGHSAGIDDIGAQTMRKTWAWNLYEKAGDIGAVRKAVGCADRTSAYEYIDENPDIAAKYVAKTPDENAECRKELVKDNAGIRRINAVVSFLRETEAVMKNPATGDAFYGKTSDMLDRMESVVNAFKKN